jgi:hypothetical protein
MTIPRRIGRKFSELYALRIFAPPFRVPGFDVAVACSALATTSTQRFPGLEIEFKNCNLIDLWR